MQKNTSSTIVGYILGALELLVDYTATGLLITSPALVLWPDKIMALGYIRYLVLAIFVRVSLEVGAEVFRNSYLGK